MASKPLPYHYCLNPQRRAVHQAGSAKRRRLGGGSDCCSLFII